MKITYLLAVSSVALVSSVSAVESAKLEISVSTAGVVALGGQTVTMEELARHLQTAAAQKKKPELLIIASEDTPMKLLSSVMDLCRKCGFTKFSLQSRSS